MNSFTESLQYRVYPLVFSITKVVIIANKTKKAVTNISLPLKRIFSGYRYFV